MYNQLSGGEAELSRRLSTVNSNRDRDYGVYAMGRSGCSILHNTMRQIILVLLEPRKWYSVVRIMEFVEKFLRDVRTEIIRYTLLDKMIVTSQHLTKVISGT